MEVGGWVGWSIGGGVETPDRSTDDLTLWLTLMPNFSPHLAATHASSSGRFISFDSVVKSRACLVVGLWLGCRGGGRVSGVFGLDRMIVWGAADTQRQQHPYTHTRTYHVRSASPSRSRPRPPAPAAHSAPATCPPWLLLLLLLLCLVRRVVCRVLLLSCAAAVVLLG